MPMRTLLDCEGTPVRLMKLYGRYARETMLEGNPYMERKFRLMQGRKFTGRPGFHVAGLDELEAEIKLLTMSAKVWAPHEAWNARLLGCDDWERKVVYQLDVDWYQESCEPIERLTSIVAELDFKKLAKEIPIEVD